MTLTNETSPEIGPITSHSSPREVVDALNESSTGPTYDTDGVNLWCTSPSGRRIDFVRGVRAVQKCLEDFYRSGAGSDIPDNWVLAPEKVPGVFFDHLMDVLLCQRDAEFPDCDPPKRGWIRITKGYPEWTEDPRGPWRD